MRTTINIDEHVLARAKDEARDSGVTLGQYIERALHREYSARGAVVEPLKLPTFGGKLLIPLDRMTNAEIQEFLDKDVPLDKRR